MVLTPPPSLQVIVDSLKRRPAGRLNAPADPLRGWEAFSKLFRYIKYIHSIYICSQCRLMAMWASSDRETGVGGRSNGRWTYIYIPILYVCGTNQSVSERDNIHTNVINDLQLTHWICTSSSIYYIHTHIYIYIYILYI